MSRFVLGVDEAGRGAVIGPLVMGGVLFKDDKKTRDLLSKYGVKDSKLLSVKRREELFKVVKEISLKYSVFRIKPKELDSKSLNDLELKYTARIINKTFPEKVFVDVPASGRGVFNYCKKLEELVNHRPRKIIGENRLDITNILVSAASIIVKEEREKAIKKLHKKYGDFGSGYPSDPKTRRWLKIWKRNNKDWPEIVRTKWSTIQKI